MLSFPRLAFTKCGFHIALSVAAISGIMSLIPSTTWARGGGGGGHGSSGGSVNVNGYYRGNGTYVAPYTRSAPGGGASSDYSSGNGAYIAPYTRSAPGGGASSDYLLPNYSQQSLMHSLPKPGGISSGGESSISSIEVNINGKSFGKVGIMVNGQAYVPTECSASIILDPTDVCSLKPS